MARGDHLASTPAGEPSSTHQGSPRALPTIRAWLGGHAAVLQQATRLAVAATLAIAVVQLLRLPAGFWAPLSALAVMQGQIGASVAAARNYILANIVGVLLGALIIVTFGKDLPVVALGIFAIATLATALRLPPASASTASAIIPVLVLSVEGNPWHYGGYRLLDILIGMAVAVLVSLVVFPARAVVQLRAEVAVALREVTVSAAQALTAVAAGSRPAETPGVSAGVVERLHTAEGLLAAARFEPLHRREASELLPFYLAYCTRIFERADTLVESAADEPPAAAVRALAPALADAARAVQATGAALATAVQAGVAGAPVDGGGPALAALRGAITRLQTVDLSTILQGNELLRAYAFVYALGDLARELEEALHRIEQPNAVPTPEERTALSQNAAPASGGHGRWWERRRAPR